MLSQKKSLWFFVGMIGTMILIALTAGCQVDVAGSVGAKSFYPDSVGDNEIGDPRKPMYGGSGYGERHTAGSDNGTPAGFQRLEVPHDE